MGEIGCHIGINGARNLFLFFSSIHSFVLMFSARQLHGGGGGRKGFRIRGIFLI